MGRPKKIQDDYEDSDGITGELKPMDFAGAAKIYRNDFKPAQTRAAVENQTKSTAVKAIKKQCNIQPQSATHAFRVYEMEDAHRDDYVRGFVGSLNELLGYELITFNGADLVDLAEAKGALLKAVTTPSVDPDIEPAMH